MYWNGLYGMNDMELDEIVEFGRSWAYAAEIEVSKGFTNLGYDTSERCYLLEDLSPETKDQSGDLSIKIKVLGTSGSPVINPAFYVKNWNGEVPRVFVDGKEMKDARIGLKYELDGTDLIVYLPLKSTKKVQIEFRTGI